jgi:hypothetical protein
VLLLLKDHADQEWTAESVSQTLYSTPSSVGKRLADLCGRGLLAAVEAPAGGYRYAPATPEKARLLDRVAEAYHERRVAVITLIYSKPHDQVQAFADAFKLRKDKE